MGQLTRTDWQDILYHIICSSIEEEERITKREHLELLCLSSLGTILGAEALLSNQCLMPACRCEEVTELFIFLHLQAHLRFAYKTVFILTQQFSDICSSHSLPHGDLWAIRGRPSQGLTAQCQSTANIFKNRPALLYWCLSLRCILL